MYPSITYLTDCTDAHARARLSNRIGALFGHSPVLLPLEWDKAELTAGLILLDTLRATDMLGEDGYPTLIMVNTAPRDGKWDNGAPFCYFRYRSHLVVATFSPRTLGLVRRHLGVKKVWMTDVRTVVQAAADSWAKFTPAEVEAIATTQFRSLWYQPLLAKWLLDDQPVPAEEIEIPASADEHTVVANVDNFGNCKLTCRADSIDYIPGGQLTASFYSGEVALGTHTINCYHRLSEVPQGQPGFIVGSSGEDFLELVVFCRSAAEMFGLSVGCEVRFGLPHRGSGLPELAADDVLSADVVRLDTRSNVRSLNGDDPHHVIHA